MTIRSRTLTLSLTLRVKRMSAYEQPAFFAAASAISDNPLNFDRRTVSFDLGPAGDCAMSVATRSLAASPTPEAAMVFTKSRRVGMAFLAGGAEAPPYR